MLWIKAFHIIFMVTWFAGLFYLPRLFVYHVQTREPDALQRFCVMERKLFAIMTLGAIVTILFGVWLLWLLPGLLSIGWMQLKLGIVLLLIGYHFWCGQLVRRFADGSNVHSETWFRWFNEIPALALIAIVVLAVVKPF
ncbi:MAG: protoporphyrinogen oxidase HemJ [Gammaproteobacteria bacterium]|nr:protoporphyrinogen oxidase HemJ [Gammaproteobacteria bacterium]